MARPSKIDRLGDAVKTAIARWRDDGHTIDEIRCRLDQELGVQVSRSGLGRHVQDYDLMVDEIRSAREAAAGIARELGDAPDDQVRRANLEMTEALVARVFRLARGDDGAVDPAVLKLVSEIQRNTAQASKLGLDVELRKKEWLEEERQRTLAEARQAADAAVEKVAKVAGLTSDTVAALKAEFLGIGR